MFQIGYLQFKGADVQHFFVFNILQKLFFLEKNVCHVIVLYTYYVYQK